MSMSYGETVDGLKLHGQPVLSGVFNEHQVRAAAGITLVLGSTAFVQAYFDQQYLPIKLVTLFFFVEFLVRVTLGINQSPVGLVARWMTRGRPALWASAQPKRFAWSLGLVLSLAMTIITHADIRGPLPLSICLLCMALMWLEAALGLCIGCEMYRFMMRRGWIRRSDTAICSGDSCTLGE